MYLKLFEKKFKSDSSHQNIGKLYIYKYFRHARAFFRSFIASFLRLVTIYLHRIKEVSTYTHTSWEFTSASFLSGLFFLPWRNSTPPLTPSGPGPPHYQGYMIALTHTTPGRTPLDEWSARRRNLYRTTHNNHNRLISMPLVRFEPTIPAGERPLTYALDRAVSGTGTFTLRKQKNELPTLFKNASSWPRNRVS